MSKFYSTGKAPASYPARDIGLKVERADKHIQSCRVALEDFIVRTLMKLSDRQTSSPTRSFTSWRRLHLFPALSAPSSGMLFRISEPRWITWPKLSSLPTHNPSKDTSFPILKGDLCSEPYKATFEGKVKGMGNRAIEAIKSLKPYKGGTTRSIGSTP